MASEKTRATRKKGRSQKNFHVRTVLGVRQPNGSIKKQLKTLGRKAQEHLHHQTDEEVREYINGTSLREHCLSEERRLKFLALQDGKASNEPDDSDKAYEDIPMTTEDVLQGRIELEISHAGGELQAQLQQDVNRTKRQDTRTRRDVVQRRVLGFRGQMKAITDAYIVWGATQGQYGLNAPPTPPAAAEGDVDGTYVLKVVDMFSTYLVDAPMRKSDKFIVSSFPMQRVNFKDGPEYAEESRHENLKDGFPRQEIPTPFKLQIRLRDQYWAGREN
ncbi:hypothetical protein B0H13DRAFT_1852023 [Mycena leptocephala]|nr:hypothetical protein B0H13DRAFT_1852023 [Mycena leptocephala]